MGSIRIWYNKNRVTIWTAIIIIVVVIGLIQTLNKYYKENPKEKTNYDNNYYNTNTYSVITKEEIHETTAKQSTNLIDSFIGYCNNQQPEEAYNLLSEECKQELYPTIDVFKTKYYNRIFTEKKNYNSTLWIVASQAHTYRVEIMADMLATGKKEDMPTEDYFTIVLENGQNKLNISRYIGREDINIVKEQEDIVITVLSKIQYMDYEKYKISIQNNTGMNLIFNTREKTNSIYLKDENDVKYIAFLNEILSSHLEVPSGATNNLEIKFNRGYKPETHIKNIVFEDIYANGKTKIIEVSI